MFEGRTLKCQSVETHGNAVDALDAAVTVLLGEFLNLRLRIGHLGS